MQENVSLKPYTTFGLGGPARYFAEVSSAGQLVRVLQFAEGESLPVFVLGGGSNLLISDGGYGGLVVKISVPGFEVLERKGNLVRVLAGAGESWDGFVARCIKEDLAGLECLSGIPGTLGGAVAGSIGAYGQSVQDSVWEVRVFDRSVGKEVTLSNRECEFSYRTSRFKEESGRFVILGAVFELVSSPNPLHICGYRDNTFDVRKILMEKGRPTLEDVRKVIIEVRSRKGMVLLPEYERYRSAGSFFKGPVVSAEVRDAVERKALEMDVEKTEKLSPWWRSEKNGMAKIAPAFLLEFTPFRKGYKRGNVGVSPRHSLAVVAYEGAEAKEVFDLAKDMKGAVRDLFGISLDPEVAFLGFDREF